jgi:hypothetical protein
MRVLSPCSFLTWLLALGQIPSGWKARCQLRRSGADRCKDIDTLDSDKPLPVQRSGFDNERSERLAAGIAAGDVTRRLPSGGKR